MLFSGRCFSGFKGAIAAIFAWRWVLRSSSWAFTAVHRRFCTTGSVGCNFFGRGSDQGRIVDSPLVSHLVESVPTQPSAGLEIAIPSKPKRRSTGLVILLKKSYWPYENRLLLGLRDAQRLHRTVEENC